MTKSKKIEFTLNDYNLRDQRIGEMLRDVKGDGENRADFIKTILYDEWVRLYGDRQTIRVNEKAKP